MGKFICATSNYVVPSTRVSSPGDDHVERLVGPVERPIDEDVDLDARQDAEWRELVVQADGADFWSIAATQWSTLLPS
jgi:hypothetical protein